MFQQTTKTIAFDLTDKGHPLWKAPNALGPVSPSGFCVGHMQVVSVDRFTDPVVANGAKVSRVMFTVRANYDDWAKTPAVQTAFRDELSHSQPATRTLPLVLMNDDWAIATNMPMLPQ